jgi:hypothetical protein
MRRVRFWVIGLLTLALLVGGLAAAYFTFIDTAYSRAVFYADAGLDPWRVDEGSIAGSVFVNRPGRITLALSRGEPHGIVTTYHGWNESLWIEIPRPSKDERIELDRPDARAAFGAVDGRHFAEVGDGGIRGNVQIVSADENRIVAVYDVTADACYRNPYQPCLRHEDVVFRGRSVFRLRSRPMDAVAGDIWPRARHTNPPQK